VALVYEDPWRAVLLAPFAGLMVALSVIDIRHRRIPNRLVYPAVVIAAAVIVAGDLAGGGLDVLDAGIGLFAYGLALLIIALISTGMGMGDVKLAGLIGLVLGSIGLDLVAVAAGMGILLGGVGAIVALLAGAGRKSAIPFGPYLASGAVIAVFVGRQIADSYLNLLT
jgi:leader peptidase (prepilin peptidase)/N-methyltransferase